MGQFRRRTIATYHGNLNVRTAKKKYAFSLVTSVLHLRRRSVFGLRTPVFGLLTSQHQRLAPMAPFGLPISFPELVEIFDQLAYT